MRISVVRGFCEEMANTALPPVADDGSTKGVRTTLPVVNWSRKPLAALAKCDDCFNFVKALYV
jgi:hypothetical protein